MFGKPHAPAFTLTAGSLRQKACLLVPIIAFDFFARHHGAVGFVEWLWE